MADLRNGSRINDFLVLHEGTKNTTFNYLKNIRCGNIDKVIFSNENDSGRRNLTIDLFRDGVEPHLEIKTNTGLDITSEMIMNITAEELSLNSDVYVNSDLYIPTQTTTIGGADWGMGWLKIGDSTEGISMDNNEIAFAGAGYIETLGSRDLSFKTNNSVRMVVSSTGVVDFAIRPTVNGTGVSLIGHNHDSDYLGVTAKASDSSQLNGMYIAGNVWSEITNRISWINSSGIMDVGRYIDFHTTNSTADYDARFDMNGSDHLLLTGSNFKIDNGVSTDLTIQCDNGGNATLNLQGTDQGTGILYVGQSASHGGGIFYNGDGTPSFATGEGADRVSFYRRTGSVNHVVFSYSHGDSSVAFTATPTVNGTSVSLSNHTHSYLPLSGGTVTGTIQSNVSTGGRVLNVGGTASGIFKFTDQNSLGVHSDSALMLFAGDTPTKILDGLSINNVASCGEDVILAADSAVRIYAGQQNGFSTVGNVQITSSGAFFSSDISVSGATNCNGGLKQDGHVILNGTDTWLRTTGSTGWYSSSHGGGIYMTDSTYVKTYNNKNFKVEGGARFYVDTVKQPKIQSSDIEPTQAQIDAMQDGDVWIVY